MPASPAFTIELTRFGVWRLAVVVLAALSAAAAGAWLMGAQSGAAVPLGLVGGGCVAAALSLMRAPACQLRWDGQLWWLSGVAGELVVAIDTGGWMLLHFGRSDGPWRSRSAWLPAQRRGLAGSWHALRCAVYSPRPAPGGPAAADSAAPSPE